VGRMKCDNCSWEWEVDDTGFSEAGHPVCPSCNEEMWY